jgi:V/A-type H+/Na+-transporting ATPase subunit K
MRSSSRFIISLVVATAILAVLTTALLVSPGVLAAPSTQSGGVPSDSASLAFIAAAISTGLAALGAGFAVAKVGAAAIGALAEKPELFGRLLIFIGLAEGIAIYGLIVSILVLNRLA